MHSHLILVVVLYAISLCSIASLLLTTYIYKVKWHPVVGVILWMLVPSAIVALLHYPLDDVLRERLPIIPLERPWDQQYTALAYFCAVDGILLYIFSAISSGLTVSFALSLFAVVVKSKHTGISTSPRTWRSFRWLWDPSATTLCVAPFIWSLPLIPFGIEAIMRNFRTKNHPPIYYSNTYCNIDDRVYQMVSGIILGSPLLIAAALIFAIIGNLVHLAVKGRGMASQSVNIPLALRFAAIVIQIFITAILMLCEISLQDDQLRGVFDLHTYWTSVTPLVFFIIFGTQQELMAIWKYWAYRLAGKQPQYTPRPSNEAQTLSGSSAPGTIDPQIIRKLGGGAHDTYKGKSKGHRASSSAGGRTSGSIADPLGLAGMKHSTDPSDLSCHIDQDLEAAIPENASKAGLPTLSLVTPELLRPESPKAPSLAMHPGRPRFYSSASIISSQALASPHSPSGTRGLLASQNDLTSSQPPLIVVNDGFGAVFGAQVPANTGMMGRPIMTRQERERWLATDRRQQRPRAEYGRERRQSVGLPPPPRSPRQSNARPSSAGGVTALEPNRRRGAELSSGASPSLNWDSHFHFGSNVSVQDARNRELSNGGSGSDLGIEMEENVKTPSSESGNFERGHVRRESRQESLRSSWVSKDSRASVASDRTFG
ncbi:unnamed protein product [Rhizoctonia solani]|uniref:Uncharacterized protein n=1 Tax=Rhizoctonia solani TaxID=456999 RepID=A0A8H3GY98_9AGAM|nr:unnamed protein product [Rhizoctonia solani]